MCMCERFYFIFLMSTRILHRRKKFFVATVFPFQPPGEVRIHMSPHKRSAEEQTTENNNNNNDNTRADDTRTCYIARALYIL